MTSLSSSGHLLGAGVHDPLRQPPAVPAAAGLDAAAQARLHEAHHHAHRAGHDLHQASLPGDLGSKDEESMLTFL